MTKIKAKVERGAKPTARKQHQIFRQPSVKLRVGPARRITCRTYSYGFQHAAGSELLHSALCIESETLVGELKGR